MRKYFILALVVYTILMVLVESKANGETFGIKFLGNTINTVTNTAGVLPIGGWNNINNTNAFTTGKIWSSDGMVSATLTLTGSGHANGWNSGTTADGGNGSLMQGYCDAQANSPVTVTISGLTGASYTIYLYTQADAARPSNTGDWIPNYTINGTTLYTPTMTPPFNWYVQGGLTLVNTNTYPTPFAYGNYVMWDNGFATNGVITISANMNNRSYRSPLNGIELVLNTNIAPGQARPINIMPLGDSITWGYPDADVTGGYRLSLYQLLTNASFMMDYVGTQVTITPGLPYPNHEGHSGYRIDQINSGLLSYVDSIPSPDLILLLIGANDIGQNYELSTATNRLDGLISNITSNCPAAKLIVANLLPQGDTNNNNEINTIFNPYVPGLVAKHAANGEQVYFTDMNSALATNDLVDGSLHPNPGGYIKMGNQWFNAINALYAPFTDADLALNKSAAASSVQGSNVASNAVDGNATSYWSSVFSDPQWISGDLGFVQIINRVRWIWTLAYGKSYQVQISNDNTNWTSVYNTANGIGGTNSVSFSPAGARYVRIYGTARGTGLGYGISEMQVYAPPLLNLALNKTATALSMSDPIMFNASNAVDGNAATCWSSQNNDVEWISVDLGSMQSVGGVSLNWNNAYGKGYEIQVSTDNTNWTRVYNTDSGTGGIDNISFTAVMARYVRMYGMQRGTPNGYSLNEFAVYRPLNAPANNQFQSLTYISNLTAAVGQSNSSITLNWASSAQQAYGIQYATNLATPFWYDYEVHATATGTVTSVLLPIDGSQKFFRVKPAF